MKEKIDYFELIDDFILGKLNDDMQDSFEQELSHNEELALNVEQQRKLYSGILKAGRKDFMSDLKEIHEEVVDKGEKSSKIVMFNWRPILAVASILVAVLFSWWLISTPSDNTQNLFADNYQPFALNQTLRDGDQDQELIRAAELYKNKNYKESLLVFQKIGKSNNSASIKMAIAISHFENKNTEKAISTLQEIIDAEDPFLTDLAHWYSALFYLHSDQKAKAIQHFRVLASSDQNDKYSESKEILDKLQ